MYFRGVFLLVKKGFLEILVWGCFNIKKIKIGVVVILRIVEKSQQKQPKTSQDKPTASQETAKKENKKNKKIIEKWLTNKKWIWYDIDNKEEKSLKIK